MDRSRQPSSAIAGGQARTQASRLLALGTVIGGVGSAFSQYNGGLR